jgi:hypothetical protein
MSEVTVDIDDNAGISKIQKCLRRVINLIPRYTGDSGTG